MYSTNTIVQITITIEQLERMFDERLAKAFDNYKTIVSKESVLPDFLTRKQTSETLQVSYTTLHSWAKDTDDRSAILIPLKIRGQVRYRKNDVLAALKENRRYKA